MSGATVAEFIAYWEGEGQAYVRRGDYAWMAGLVPGQRVLEIGCGIGFGTQALVDRFNLLMCAGQLSDATVQLIVNALKADKITPDSSDDLKQMHVGRALAFVMCGAEYLVQR